VTYYVLLDVALQEALVDVANDPAERAGGNISG